ncbi:MAG TPA: hypothetical protein VHR86_03305 [Armatimonadota bacterium]|nr:hypothetical protein [Armatimonadota bacterium]
MAGKAALHERLRFDKEGKPAVYVFNTCRDWIRTVPSLPYDKRKVEDVDTEAEDHAYDDTRYFLMSRPMPVREYGKVVKQDLRFHLMGNQRKIRPRVHKHGFHPAMPNVAWVAAAPDHRHNAQRFFRPQPGL